ncbi:pyridoxamine 5'-phosphate oxidase family protein [Amycolatopsis pithecellobii]|uniref:Pyridoxamine 5'-phosphate oxidase family protein n=1 Tax=Amycolatopsis pithecellobii TaxID=664692 RepID=A0A6N7ZAM8_9PSEU|nr:pyridoxamine 5'-phosphate oxidase family protein [Amycolatopsis pithecellobii]MTD58804.1 pyridoxamine 5'-phosphate oxidase family protein [Amycolatopsis pithecellobii]
MTEIRPLTPQECVRLLPTQPIGRLAFSEHALPTVRPVNFFLDNDDIIVRTSQSGSMSRLSGEVVAFEVDSVDAATHTGWSVVVIGRIATITDIDELVRLAGPAHRPWAGGERARFLRLPIEMISGRTLLLNDRGTVSAAS